MTQKQAAAAPSLRALILKTIDLGGAIGVNDEMCLSVVAHAHPDVGMERIRSELASLEADGLVTLLRRENRPLRVRFTQRGRDMADSQT